MNGQSGASILIVVLRIVSIVYAVLSFSVFPSDLSFAIFMYHLEKSFIIKSTIFLPAKWNLKCSMSSVTSAIVEFNRDSIHLSSVSNDFGVFLISVVSTLYISMKLTVFERIFMNLNNSFAPSRLNFWVSQGAML